MQGSGLNFLKSFVQEVFDHIFFFLAGDYVPSVLVCYPDFHIQALFAGLAFKSSPAFYWQYVNYLIFKT